MKTITRCAIALFFVSGCVDGESLEAVRSVRPTHSAPVCGSGADCFSIGPAAPSVDCTVSCGDGQWQPQCGEECDPGLHDSCSDTCAPIAEQCNPVYRIGCGQTIVGSTGDIGSTEGLGQYACATWSPMGREVAYEFVAPEEPMEVEVFVTGYEQYDPFVFLVEQGEAGCSPSACMRAGRQTHFPSALRERMALVVDSRADDWGTFEMTVVCTPQAL
jgi:hypothetical protein